MTQGPQQPNDPTTAITFETREVREIEYAIKYYLEYNHGTPGHLTLVTLAKVALQAAFTSETAPAHLVEPQTQTVEITLPDGKSYHAPAPVIAYYNDLIDSAHKRSIAAWQDRIVAWAANTFHDQDAVTVYTHLRDKVLTVQPGDTGDWCADMFVLTTCFAGLCGVQLAPEVERVHAINESSRYEYDPMRGYHKRIDQDGDSHPMLYTATGPAQQITAATHEENPMLCDHGEHILIDCAACNQADDL